MAYSGQAFLVRNVDSFLIHIVKAYFEFNEEIHPYLSWCNIGLHSGSILLIRKKHAPNCFHCLAKEIAEK